jgi:hypothetical protein
MRPERPRADPGAGARRGRRCRRGQRRERAGASACAVGDVAREPRARRGPQPGDPPVDPSCSNDVGTLAACSRIGPSCEGIKDECRSIRSDLRPRVTAAFAECFAKVKRPKCRDKALGACMRAAVESTCIEQSAVNRCRDIMRACRDAKKEPKYTLAQCAKVIAAVPAGGGPGDWDKVDVERLGPSSEGGACSLRWVLPYQPWGPSWD